MICGGAEAAITPMGVGGLRRCAHSPLETRRPKGPAGPSTVTAMAFVIGEGAGIVILEELGFALRRGAPFWRKWWVTGCPGDAFHITQPSEDADGAVRVMRNTLADAKILSNQVDYINAHGTSTPYNDRLETLAIKKVFGEQCTESSPSARPNR